MESQSSFFSFLVRRPIGIIMVASCATVFGILSYLRLPLSLMPKIQYPRVTVRTEYKGASPYEVESMVTEPIERALGVLPHLTSITSVSRSGVSEVICEFSWKANVSDIILTMRENLDQVRLPEEVEPPQILRYDPSLDPIMRIGISGDLPLVEIRQIVEEEIQRVLGGVPGVASAVIRGGASPIVAIELRRDLLERFGISPSLVVQRIKESNVTLTGGTIREGDSLYLVRILGEFQSLDQLKSLVLTYKQGIPIRLEHVAEVSEKGGEEVVISRVMGKEAVEVLIYKEADANLLEVAREVRKVCFSSQKGRPSLEERWPTLRFTILSDTSQYVEKAIEEAKNSAILGGILAICVLFFFLQDLKFTLIVGISIPLSLLLTFVPMYLFGISLNIMSLGGLALAAGLVVDASIVVLEAIFRRREKGEDLETSAVQGTREVGGAVLASTLTTISVFFPIVFVEGVGGRLFSEQAFTVSFSLLFSLLVALGFIPPLAGLGKKRTEKREKRENLWRWKSLEKLKGEWNWVKSRPFLLIFWLVLGGAKNLLFLLLETMGKVFLLVLWVLFLFFQLLFFSLAKASQVVLYLPFSFFRWGLKALEKIYLFLLHKVLDFSLVAVFLSLLLFGGSLWPFFHLAAQLLPDLHQGEVEQRIRLPSGTELKETDRILTFVQEKLKKMEEVALVASRAGGTPDDWQSQGEESGLLLLRFRPPFTAEKERDVVEKMQKLFREIPNVELVELKRPQLFSFQSPIEVEVIGPDLKVLEETARKIYDRLLELPVLENLRLGFRPGKAEVQVVLHQDKLLRLGLSLEEVARRIQQAFQGESPTFWRREGERREIWIRFREEDRRTLQDLENLNIQPEGEVPIPLRAVADITYGQAPAEIYHVDHSRAIVIQADVRGMDLGGAVKAVENSLEALSLPPSVAVNISGQYKEMLRSRQSLIFAFLLAAFLVYVVMASIFESLAQPFLIMFSLPFAFVGIGWSLYFLEMTLNVMVFIGAIMLAGIVVNNSIVLLDKANQIRREGKKVRESMIQAASLRLRPILMTTLTTVFGLLPLALGYGEGVELRRPLAITVLSGLVTSTILTLFLIPTLYVLWEGIWEKK